MCDEFLAKLGTRPTSDLLIVLNPPVELCLLLTEDSMGVRGEHKIQTRPPTDISESPTGPSDGLKRVSGEEMLKNRVCVGLDGRAWFLQIQNRVNRT